MHKIDNYKYLAIIPARGGSKGIPGKNIKLLKNKPLISYTIEAAKACKYIDSVVVSTDSTEIAEISKKYGASVPFLRPEELARDDSKTIDGIIYTIDKLKEMGKEYDYLVLLQATSPLRTSNDIEKAIEFSFEKDKDLAAISLVSDSPILIRQIDNDGNLTKMLDSNSTIRRQDMPDYYRINGSIYINKIDNLSNETSFNDNPLGYVIPREHAIDIDEEVDFSIADYYLSTHPPYSK